MSTREIILLILVIFLSISLLIVTLLMFKYKKESMKEEKESEEEIKDIPQNEKSKRKQSFDPNSLDTSLVKTTEKLVSLSEFVATINKHIDKKQYKNISTSTVVSWLINNGYITKEEKTVTKIVLGYSATENGISVGIVNHYNENKTTGELIPNYLLSESAQKFILDSLINIYSAHKTKQTDQRTGLRWTKEEENQLIDEYVNQKLPISKIAKIHQRQNGGIKRRLMDLGIIEKEFIPYRRKKK